MSRRALIAASAMAAAGMLAAALPVSSPSGETMRIANPAGAKSAPAQQDRVLVTDAQAQAVRRHSDWRWGSSGRSAGNPADNRAWKHRPIAARTKRRKAKAKARRRRMRA
jgi:hypothetical protein